MVLNLVLFVVAAVGSVSINKSRSRVGRVVGHVLLWGALLLMIVFVGI